MSLTSQKAGTRFGRVNNVTRSGPKFFARLIVKAAKELNMTPTVKLVSEGLGTIDAEGTFEESNWGGDGIHIGPWAEEPGFGSRSERLDPERSTYLAIKRRKEDGSFQQAWWQWETGETEGTGQDRAHKYVKIAEEAGAGGGNPSLGEEIPVIGGIIGDIEGGAESALSAGEFLAELASTILDFRKLGQLAAQAGAWWLRLIAKAVWDYVIAPIVHWAERAETFYFRNFFGVGVEKGSGFGYQLRQNAGIITIAFWALGYAILWSDGESLFPTSESHNSMLGQTVKKIEGVIARRNLVKPENVEKETPTKPKPVSSSIQIEKTRELKVNRKRPVAVSGTGVEAESQTGRKNNDGDRRIPRPSSQATEGKTDGDKKIHLPPGVERKISESEKEKNSSAVSESGMDSRTGSSGGSPGGKGNR